MEKQENIELKFKELMNYMAAAKHNYRIAMEELQDSDESLDIERYVDILEVMVKVFHDQNEELLKDLGIFKQTN